MQHDLICLAASMLHSLVRKTIEAPYMCSILVWSHRQSTLTIPELGREPGMNERLSWSQEMPPFVHASSRHLLRMYVCVYACMHSRVEHR